MDEPAGVHSEDPLERFEAYRLARRLFNDFWRDSDVMGKDYRGKELVRQMVRSIASISANMEEGYGSHAPRDLGRFLRIALGSARESRGWYARSAALLPYDTIRERCAALDQIIGLLVATLRRMDAKAREEAGD